MFAIGKVLLINEFDSGEMLCQVLELNFFCY